MSKVKTEEVVEHRMDKDQFVYEIDLEHGDDEIKVDVDYAYKEFIHKVEPNLELMNFWYTEDNMTIPLIRKALGVSQNVWRVIKRMNTVQMYLDKDNKFLQAKLDMELLEAKRKHDGNAKFYEMANKRFIKNYEEGNKSDIPARIEFKVVEGGMDDKAIEHKAGNLNKE